MKEIMKNSEVAQLVKTLSDEVKTQYVDEWFELSNGAVDREFLSKIYDSVQDEYIACVIKGESMISREKAETAFERFKKNYEVIIKSDVFEYSNPNEITREIDKFSKHFTNELIGFLFEKYVGYGDYINSPKDQTLLCVKHITGTVDDNKLSKESKENIYAMLRLAFESGDCEQKESAVSIIENLRDKICLQIIIDSINNDYLDNYIISYAKSVQKELEYELDLDNIDK